ncbi:MAG: hypothetical protein KDA89_23935, partial [Planctomycetaceae bacterium]|nr:hypothetical protein [Planctomycetaceae bacterium]
MRRPVESADNVAAATAAAGNSSRWPVIVPLTVVLLSIGWLAGKARPAKPAADTMNLTGFAEIPVAWRGRPQPIDSFARTELLMTAHKSTFAGELREAELNETERRKKILNRIQKAWPTIDAEQFTDFSGDYDAWIENVMKITSSGRETVEANLRDVLVARMPAVRWLLDVIADPAAANRHRIIRIDDDQILAMLGLEKRSGLLYSVSEIQQNMKDLEAVHSEGLKLQMAEQEHRMSQLQRRVVSLVQTVRRIDSMQNVFLSRESDNLMEAIVDAWWVFERLGSLQAVMAVPTGDDDEQRSWETLIAAGALRAVIRQMQEHGLKTADDVKSYIADELPKSLVSRSDLKRSVEGSMAILQQSLDTAAAESGEKPAADALQKKAAAAAQAMAEDPVLQRVLRMIADSAPGATPEEIVAAVSDDMLMAMGREHVTSQSGIVLSELQQKENDPRMKQIRRPAPPTTPDEEAVFIAQVN